MVLASGRTVPTETNFVNTTSTLPTTTRAKTSVTVVDETKFGAEYDSKFYERLAWYAKTDLENDRLEEIDLRATAAFGLKYFWVKNDSYDLSARSGIAFRFEEYDSSKNSTLSEPALDFGLEYSRKIRNFLFLEGDLTYVPSVNDFTDFLLSNDIALVVPLDKKEKLEHPIGRQRDL